MNIKEGQIGSYIKLDDLYSESRNPTKFINNSKKNTVDSIKFKSHLITYQKKSKNYFLFIVCFPHFHWENFVR